VVVPLSAKKVFELMICEKVGQESWLEKAHKVGGDHTFAVTEWIDGKRDFNYIIKLSNPMRNVNRPFEKLLSCLHNFQ